MCVVRVRHVEKLGACFDPLLVLPALALACKLRLVLSTESVVCRTAPQLQLKRCAGGLRGRCILQEKEKCTTAANPFFSNFSSQYFSQTIRTQSRQFRHRSKPRRAETTSATSRNPIKRHSQQVGGHKCTGGHHRPQLAPPVAPCSRALRIVWEATHAASTALFSTPPMLQKHAPGTSRASLAPSNRCTGGWRKRCPVGGIRLDRR